MQYHYFQNNTIITCYTNYGIQIEGKEMYPIFDFANVLLVSSLLNSKAWQVCAQQTEKNHPHTNSAVSHQVRACPASSASIVYFFNMWFGMVQNQTKFRCGEDRKIGKKFNDCAELKKITISLFYSNCLIYSSRFCKSFKFRYCPFCLIEKKEKLESTLQVCCLFYFLLLSTFFKGKVKSGFHCF